MQSPRSAHSMLGLSMPKPVPVPERRRRRRRIWPRRLAILLAILLAPVIAIVIYNRIDEAPSALALQYGQTGSSVADENNAWLALVGIGAAADQAPLDWARQWVAAQNEGAAVPPVPLPQRAPDIELYGIAEHCPHRMVRCLEWSEWNSHGIEKLASANSLRLERYERVLKLTGWQDLLEPRLDSPTPEGFQTARLYIDVQALALLRAIESDDAVALNSAFGRIYAHARFWSNVAGQADSMIAAMVAAAQINQAQRLGAELADRLRADQLAGIDGTLNALLAIDPTAIDWQGAMGGEHRLFANTLDDSIGFWAALSKGQISEALMGLFYAPQATRNLHAHLTHLISLYLAAPLPQREAAQEPLARFSESLMPPLSEAARIPGYFSHNAVGKILIAIAVPAWKNYGDRVWDYEAIRRASALKLRAISNDVDPDEMLAFIGTQPLVDPWTQQPFDWNPLRREVGFEPRSDHGRNTIAAVPYRAVSPPGVYPCPQQLGVALTLGEGEPMFYRSCGDGLDAVRMVSADGPDVSHDHDPNAALDSIRLRGTGDRIWVEVWHRNDASEWRRHGAEIQAGGEPTPLQPIGHDTALDLVVSGLAPRQDRWLSVHQPNSVPVAQLAEAFASALKISTVGIEHLAVERVPLRMQAPAAELYPLLAEVGGVDFAELSPTQAVFRRRR